MDVRLRAKRASNELQMHSKHQNKGKGIVRNRFCKTQLVRSCGSFFRVLWFLRFRVLENNGFFYSPGLALNSLGLALSSRSSLYLPSARITGPANRSLSSLVRNLALRLFTSFLSFPPWSSVLVYRRETSLYALLWEGGIWRNRPSAACCSWSYCWIFTITWLWRR